MVVGFIALVELVDFFLLINLVGLLVGLFFLCVLVGLLVSRVDQTLQILVVVVFLVVENPQRSSSDSDPQRSSSGQILAPPSDMKYLGLSSSFHDSLFCLGSPSRTDVHLTSVLFSSFS